MGDVTANFSIQEFLVSDTAERLGIENTPTAEHLKRLKTVTIPAAQILRDGFKRSIMIMSGYRNPKLNKAVGGVPNSDHAQAYAFDFRVAGLTARQAAQQAVEILMAADKDWDQIILESSRNVVHASFAPRLRCSVLTQAGGPGTPVVVGIK